MEHRQNNTNIHPYCNLTPNKPLNDELLDQSLYFVIPIPWLVTQIIFIFLFFAFSFYVLYEITKYMQYQFGKRKHCSEIFYMYHYHLIKLIFLFFASSLRFIWLLEPYYITGI